MVTDVELRRRLEESFNPSHLEVIDESDGCGKKFVIVIVSDHFLDKSTLSNHRAVQGALADYMDSIHALTIKAYDSEKWKNPAAPE